MKIFQIFPGITPNIHKHKLATFPATNHRRHRLNVASNLRSARYNLVAPTIKSATICSATSHTKRSLSNSIFTKVVPQKNVKCHTTELFLMRQLSCHLSKEPVSRSGLLPPSARWIVVVTRSDDLPGFSAKYSGCPWLQLPGSLDHGCMTETPVHKRSHPDLPFFFLLSWYISILSSFVRRRQDHELTTTGKCLTKAYYTGDGHVKLATK